MGLRFVVVFGLVVRLGLVMGLVLINYIAASRYSNRNCSSRSTTALYRGSQASKARKQAGIMAEYAAASAKVAISLALLHLLQLLLLKSRNSSLLLLLRVVLVTAIAGVAQCC